ncbi:MAG: hypothetical protein NTV93_13560 [Verrucomicrobia bacterium]|nr:hypothetical protein [Verrucomicrobiota bacterium]
MSTRSDRPSPLKEELARIVEIEYGGLPPAPPNTRSQLLHDYEVPHFHGGRYQTHRLTSGQGDGMSFGLNLLIPPGAGPFPVVLCGDACWRNADDQVADECLRRGFILALFNRTELAVDADGGDRSSGLYPLYPGFEFGAISAWAWGYHRCVDFLCDHAAVRPDQIAIVGHSRGGKAVLLAGATDPRIALTSPNNSGTGGAASYHVVGEGAEPLEHLIRVFPHWLGPGMAGYANDQERLPFDQHTLIAAIAPRAYLSTEALGDLWANPSGARHAHQLARDAWCAHGAESRVAIHFREGKHGHEPCDWRMFLDFAEWQFGRLSHAPALNQAGRPG